MDFFTVLTTRGKSRPIVTKKISRSPDGEIVKDNFNRKLKFYDVDQRRVASLEDVYTLLNDLQLQPMKCLMRGALADGSTTKVNVRRRLKKPTQPDGEFIEGKHRWLPVDMDDFPCPEGVDPFDVVKLYIDEYLPPEFQRRSFVLQWSSGAGLDGWKQLRAHLWFMMDRVVGDKKLLSWGRWWNEQKGWKVVDPMVYASNEPIYVAAPIFEDGVADPCPDRLIFVRNEFEAVPLLLPPLDWRPSPLPSSPPSDDAIFGSAEKLRSRYSSSFGREENNSYAISGAARNAEHDGGEGTGERGETNDYAISGFVAEKWRTHLAQLGDDKQGFHEPLLRATGSYVFSKGDAHDRQFIKAEILEAAQAAFIGNDRLPHVLDQLGKVDEMIDGAYADFCAGRKRGGSRTDVPYEDKNNGLPILDAISFMRAELFDNGKRQGKAQYAAKLSWTEKGRDGINPHDLEHCRYVDFTTPIASSGQCSTMSMRWIIERGTRQCARRPDRKATTLTTF